MEQHQMPPFSPSSGSSSSSSSSSFSPSSCVSEEQGGDGSYFPKNSIAVPFRWEATPGRPKLEEENLLMPNLYPLRPPPIPKDFSTTQYSRGHTTTTTLGEAFLTRAKINKDGRMDGAGTNPIVSNYGGTSRKKDGHFDDRINPIASNYGGLMRKKDGRIDDDRAKPIVNNYVGTLRKKDDLIGGDKANPIVSNYGGTLRKKDARINDDGTDPIMSNYVGALRKNVLRYSHCKEIEEEEIKREEIEEEEIKEEAKPAWKLPRSCSQGYYDAPSSPMPKLKDVLKESAPRFEYSTPLRRSNTCRRSSAHANADNKPSSSCNPFSFSSHRLGLFLNKSLCLETLLLQNVRRGNKSKSKDRHAKKKTRRRIHSCTNNISS